MSNDHTINPGEIEFEDAADAAMDGQLAMLARVDGLAMPEGLEAALVMNSAAAVRGGVAPPLTRPIDTRAHSPQPRVVRARRWRVAGAQLAAGVALVLVLSLAIVAKREGPPAGRGEPVAANPTQGTSGTIADSGYNTAAIQDTSDWAIVTAVLGDTPAGDLRDLWTDATSLDERINFIPSSSELLTSEGSL